MASESWVLDGVILTSGTFTLMELTADPPASRADWISAADSESAALLRQVLHENRTITMKIRVTPQSTMDTALDRLGTLIDKLRLASATPDGIGLVWTPNESTRSRTFDVLEGKITGLPIALSGDGYSWLLKSPIVTVEMTCKPYWRGTRVLTSTTSSSTPFVTAEIAGVTGDIPALGELIVTDTATQSRRHVEWGLEGPLTYNSSTSLLIDSDDMVTSGFAGTQTTQTGAYDPNSAGNNVILGVARTTPTALCGTGNLSHVGVFRVKGRFYCSPLTQMRFAWQAGDGAITSNAWVDSPGVAGWNEIDLGTITIPVVISGTQRWTGRVEIQTPSSTNNLYIDYLTLIPAADGYGKARASYTYSAGVLVGYDDFLSTTAGNALNARAASAGGSWATSGDGTDFTFADAPGASDETVSRAAVSGTAGRFGLLGTSTPTDVEVQADTYITSPPLVASTSLDAGVVARYVDASNYLYATLRRTYTGSPVKALEIRQVLAGVETVLSSVTYTGFSTSVWLTVDLIAYATGRIIAQLRTTTGSVLATATANSTAVATAGALASGKSGIFDRNTSATASTRYYDNVSVSTPAAEPIVVYSGKNMQIRYDDVFRQDSTATYVGRPQSYRGSRFMVPVGTSRVLVKARRNDVEAALDDNVTDALQIQIGWTPRGLAVPRA